MSISRQQCNAIIHELEIQKQKEQDSKENNAKKAALMDLESDALRQEIVNYQNQVKYMLEKIDSIREKEKDIQIQRDRVSDDSVKNQNKIQNICNELSKYKALLQQMKPRYIDPEEDTHYDDTDDEGYTTKGDTKGDTKGIYIYISILALYLIINKK